MNVKYFLIYVRRATEVVDYQSFDYYLKNAKNQLKIMHFLFTCLKKKQNKS